MKTRLMILIAIMLGITATGRAEMLRDSVLIHFRQSHSNLDTTYMGNGRTLRDAERSIDMHHRPDSNYVLREIKVVGAASPEGSVSINERLSRERADRIFDYFGTRYDFTDSIATFTFIGRDWQGLRTMVSEDSSVPYRDDVLSTLDEIIAKDAHGEEESYGNLARIKSLRGGVPYTYMYRNLFPSLRASRLVLTFDNPEPAWPKLQIPATDIELTGMAPFVAVPTLLPFTSKEAKRPFYMALKTNMLFDALAVPNIGAEFYLGKNLSIVANWMYGWWDKDSTHRYWRIYGGDVALRWWFGQKAHEKPLTGHHIGVYGGVLTYDFEWGGKGYMGGKPGHWLWDRFNHEFGVEYGYSLPIARRLNIDFTLGVGYLGGKYEEYVPNGKCYEWQATKYRHWFGPTKLEVSLVWLIGRGNFNAKKGGKL